MCPAETPAWKRGFSLTAEQMEAARAERLRHNGRGTLTLEEARTWIEETGLCLFLPRRQFSSSVAPSFVEAVAGKRDATPEPKHIQSAEDMLVRLELDGVAVRLNLLGQPGEQPDFVVAGWVLPYVYALRGDRDWRRTPQLTGSRQVSPLAVQAYKLLETGEKTITELTHTLGREVTEVAVLRAITELWQQLRIIPIIDAPGKPARWQLLRVRFQKAIAEGASTSQVTAISVLASIYLQAVIAATMEDVEIFLSPLTARSKVREVLRGLVATRQVHTISLGHAPHFYVAGTLPEFTVAPQLFANSTLPESAAYFLREREEDEEPPVYRRPTREDFEEPASEPAPRHHAEPRAEQPSRPPHKPAAAPHFSRPAGDARERRPERPSSDRNSDRSVSRSSRPDRPGRTDRPSRPDRPGRPDRRSASDARPASGAPRGASNSNGRPARPAGKPVAGKDSRSAAPAWKSRSDRPATGKPAGKPGERPSSGPRKDARGDARPSRPANRSTSRPAAAKNNGHFSRPNKSSQGARKRG